MKKIIYLSVIISLNFFLPDNLSAQKERLTNEYKESVIKKISILIKSNYVLKDKRDTIALKMSNLSGYETYNKIQDPESFGQQLTIDLHEISKDHHFTVVYDPSRVAEMKIEDDEEPDEKELEESQKED